jgi:hypothetical protein
MGDWPRRTATSRRRPLLDHGLPDLPGQLLEVAPLGGQAGLDLAALGGQPGPQELLALGLAGQLGGEGLDLPAQPVDPVDGGPVGPDHLLLVFGGDQCLVDAVGGQQLAEGRGRPSGVDGPEPSGQHPPGRAQAAAGVEHLPAGPGLVGAGPGQGLANLVVVLDQDLDPGVHAVDGRLDAGRLGPQVGDPPGRGVARGGAGGVVADAAEADAEEHEHDQEMPKRAQGEVPFRWRVCGRAADPLTGSFPRQISGAIPVRPRPGSSGIAREYFVRRS